MFSETGRRTGFLSMAWVLVLTVALNCACSRESEPTNPPLRVAGGQTQCLSEASQTLDRFFIGEISVQENEAFWGCLVRAIQLFQRYVRGANDSALTAVELRRFLEVYFLGELHVSDELLRELMEVKRLFLGGQINMLTREELRKTEEVFADFREFTTTLVPHMRLISGPLASSGAPTPEAVDGATAALSVVAGHLGQKLTRTGHGYSFERLQSLLLEIEKFIGQGSGVARMRPFSQVVPVISRLKGMVMGTDRRAIGAPEWAPFLQLTSQVFDVWLRYKFFISSGDWRRGLSFDQIVVSAQKGLQLLTLALGNSSSGHIATSEMEKLLEAVDEVVEPSVQFNLRAAKLAWSWIVDRVLATAVGEQEPLGLTRERLEVFGAEFSRWRESQIYLAGLPATGRGEILTFQSPLEEVRRVMLDSPWPLLDDQWGRLVIGGNPPPRLDSYSRQNLEKTLLRWVMKTYSATGLVEGLSLSQVAAAFHDLFPIAVEMGLLRPTDTQFYQRLFRESAVFMPRSDGDSRLSFVEGFEYLHYILSGWDAARMQTELARDLCGASMPEPCLFDDISQRPDAHFGNLPELRDGLVRSTPQQRKKWWRSLTGVVGLEGAELSTPDLLEMNVVVLFVETFMKRFDVDGSGTIDVVEARDLAFPIYSRVLRELLPFLGDEQMVLSFFTYLFRYGVPPDPSVDLFAELKFRHWVTHPHKWSFQADRARLTEILAALAKFTR